MGSEYCQNMDCHLHRQAFHLQCFQYRSSSTFACTDVVYILLAFKIFSFCLTSRVGYCSTFFCLFHNLHTKIMKYMLLELNLITNDVFNKWLMSHSIELIKFKFFDVLRRSLSSLIINTKCRSLFRAKIDG